MQKKPFALGLAVFLGGLITWLIYGLVNQVYFDQSGSYFFGFTAFGFVLSLVSAVMDEK